MTLSKSGYFASAGGGQNGATVDIWATSRFGGPPAENDPPPVGSPDGGPVTTGLDYGGPGAFTVIVPSIQEYYLRVQFGGISYWSDVPGNTLSGAPPLSVIVGGTPTNSAEGDVAAAGSSTSAAAVDHLHGREAFWSSSPVAAGIASAGVSPMPSHGDHVHPLTGPIWTPYNAAWTASSGGFAIGGGTIISEYTQAGKTVQFRFSMVTNSTTPGTGSYSFSLPVAAANDTSIQVATGMVIDAVSGSVCMAAIFIRANSTTINPVYYFPPTGPSANYGAPNLPVGFGIVSITGIYQSV